MSGETNSYSKELIEEAVSFLFTSAVTERMSDDLQNALYVPIRTSNGQYLAQVLADFLNSGRSVIVTGSAGGGKTSLIDHVVRILHENGATTTNLLPGSSSSPGKEVWVIRDLSEFSDDSQVASVFENFDHPRIIAANVGMLRTYESLESIQAILEILKAMQHGIDLRVDHMPIVIDMGAIDPVNQALSDLLGHPLLHSAAAQIVRSQGLDEADSVRLESLKQLLDETIRTRVVRLVESSLGPGELTFRELWNFISDVFTGGLDTGVPPTSPWFWRIFYGRVANNPISARIRVGVRPELFLSGDESRAIYKGDLRRIRIICPSWVSPGKPPELLQDEGGYLDSVLQMRWMKIQYTLLAVTQFPVIGEFSFGLEQMNNVRTELEAAGGVSSLIKKINRYFDPNSRFSEAGSALHLWMDQLVERRTEGSKAIVDYGSIAESRFRILRSLALGNVDDFALPGNRWFLGLEDSIDSHATLEVTAELEASLSKGRRVRLVDRDASDLDLSLRNFFVACANSAPVDSSTDLKVLTTREDIAQLSATVSIQPGHLEIPEGPL